MIEEPEIPVMQLHHWINFKGIFVKTFNTRGQYVKEFLRHYNIWFNNNYQNKQ